MQINKESPDQHTIQSYSDTQITINQTNYQNSLIISREAIILDWPIHSILTFNQAILMPILSLNPEIILIGHKQSGAFLPIAIMEYLSKQRIGVECMSIGAASRTFNVLLGEQRAVVVGFIF